MVPRDQACARLLARISQAALICFMRCSRIPCFGWIACEIGVPRLAQAIDDLLYRRKAGVRCHAHTKHLQGIGAGGGDLITPVDWERWPCLRSACRRLGDAPARCSPLRDELPILPRAVE